MVLIPIQGEKVGKRESKEVSDSRPREKAGRGNQKRFMIPVQGEKVGKRESKEVYDSRPRRKSR